MLARLTLTILLITTMGLFSFRRSSTPTTPPGPYKDESTNLIYSLLFCDDLNLYKTNTKHPYIHPFDVLFADQSSAAELQKIVDDTRSASRVKILAYNRLRASGHHTEKKELLAVIVEVGLDGGLDVLASFEDGTARYINQSGKMIIWEKTDPTFLALREDLFAKSEKTVSQIGPWNQPRRPFPTTGNVRITFLVSDGLYFGEGPANVLFNDPMGKPVLDAAAQMMKYLTETTLRNG
jgi:hypothetical protein